MKKLFRYTDNIIIATLFFELVFEIIQHSKMVIFSFKTEQFTQPHL
jgi:hypothetical protein